MDVCLRNSMHVHIWRSVCHVCHIIICMYVKSSYACLGVVAPGFRVCMCATSLRVVEVHVPLLHQPTRALLPPAIVLCPRPSSHAAWGIARRARVGTRTRYANALAYAVPSANCRHRQRSFDRSSSWLHPCPCTAKARCPPISINPSRSAASRALNDPPRALWDCVDGEEAAVPRSGRDTHAAPAEARPAGRTPPTRSVLTTCREHRSLRLLYSPFWNHSYSAVTVSGVPGDLEILQSPTSHCRLVGTRRLSDLFRSPASTGGQHWETEDTKQHWIL